jgi:hypothetical protein
MSYLPFQTTCRATRSFKWPQLAVLLFVTLLALPSGCGLMPRETLRIYSGPELPDAKIAKLELPSSLKIARIDGQEFDPQIYGVIKLLPGTHQFDFIYWKLLFFGSLERRVKFALEVEANHTYELTVRKRGVKVPLRGYDSAVYYIRHYGYWFSVEDVTRNITVWSDFGYPPEVFE